MFSHIFAHETKEVDFAVEGKIVLNDKNGWCVIKIEKVSLCKKINKLIIVGITVVTLKKKKTADNTNTAVIPTNKW